MQRGGFRRKYSLRSNTVGDFVSGAFFWPQVSTQMIIQVQVQSSAQPVNTVQRNKKVKDVAHVSAIGDDAASVEA
jgi:hypothetical protein